MDNKLSITFGIDKAKTIVFSDKERVPKLNITYSSKSLKQPNIITYFEFYIDAKLEKESMARKVLKNINKKLNIL